MQATVLQVWAAHVPQLIVPPQPSEMLPQVFAGQVAIGWQQPLAVQTSLPEQQAVPLQQRCPVPVQFGPVWPLATGE